MAIDDAGKHAPANEVRPSVGINFGARETEGGFAAECNAAGFAAEGAAVLCKSHLFGIAAVEHFPHDFVMIRGIVERVGDFKRIPVVTEDLLERVLVNVFHSRLSWQL